MHYRSEDAAETLQNRRDRWTFQYDHVLHNASQETVFESLASGIVDSVLDGVNGTIMAYGQTGAGKTFTMVRARALPRPRAARWASQREFNPAAALGATQIGSPASFEHRGIAPRAISQLFAGAEARSDMDVQVSVSYLEIYNERIFDLLAELDTSPEASGDLVVLEDREGDRGTYVRGLTEVPVASEEEALNQLFRGDIARTTAEHRLNKLSNRSHCVFTLHVVQRSRLGGGDRVLRAKLHLVDLAGSERLKKTMGGSSPPRGVDDTTARESMHINQSLTYLEQCVVALTSRQRSHVPFRQSKLTNVLKDSLGGNCRTLLVACIYGERAHLEETISTLKFAARMQRVQNTAEANVTADPKLLVRRLQRRIRDLEAELAMRDALAGRSGVQYDEYTPEQREELQQRVQAYLAEPVDGEETELPVNSIRQAKETFRAFKMLHSEAAAAAEERIRREYTLSRRAGAEPGSLAFEDGAGGGAESPGTAPGDGRGEDGVGEVEEGTGYHVGEAADQARPASLEKGPIGQRVAAVAGTRSPEEAREGAAMTAEPGGGRGGGSRAGEGKEGGVEDAEEVPIEDRNAAFAIFKRGPGASLHREFLDAKDRSRAQKEQVRQLAVEVNGARDRIARLKGELEAKQKEREASLGPAAEAAEEEVVDEEEYSLMREVGWAR